MEKKITYILVGCLTILYSLYLLAEKILWGSSFSNLLSIIIVPYILIKLKDLLRYEYDYKKADLLINVLIVLIVISVLWVIIAVIIASVLLIIFAFTMSPIGGSIEGFNYLIINVLIAVIGLIEILLGIKIMKLNKPGKLIRFIALLFIVCGMSTAICRIICFSPIVPLYVINYTWRLQPYLETFSQFLLFFSLGIRFFINNIKHDEVVKEL